jgi:hypothetical protein
MVSKSGSLRQAQGRLFASPYGKPSEDRPLGMTALKGIAAMFAPAVVVP